MQEIVARIRMPAVIVILDGELVSLEVFQHLGLVLQMTVALHAAAVARGRWRFLIIFHERVVLEWIGVLVRLFADLGSSVALDLHAFDAVIVRVRADANSDKSKEQGTDAGNTRDDFLSVTQLLSPLLKDWNHAAYHCDTSYSLHFRPCPCPDIPIPWSMYGSADSWHSRYPVRDRRS